MTPAMKRTGGHEDPLSPTSICVGGGGGDLFLGWESRPFRTSSLPPFTLFAACFHCSAYLSVAGLGLAPMSQKKSCGAIIFSAYGLNKISVVGRPWGNEAPGRLAAKEKLGSKKLRASPECGSAIKQKELWSLARDLRTRAWWGPQTQ